MSPDDPAFATATAEVSQQAANSIARMVTLRSELRTQIYGLLNEEQKSRADELRSQMQDWSWHRHGVHAPDVWIGRSD